MGLLVVGRNGRTGQVIIQDDRPDGAKAIFVCDVIEGFQGGITVPPEGASPAPVPGDQPTESRGKFPWLESLQFESREPFELKVDTSRLNPEETFFLTGKFIERAVQAAEEGQYEVALTSENVTEWGQVNPSSAAKAQVQA